MSRPRNLDVIAVIAAGGALGAAARYGVSLAMPTVAGSFPWATFWVNVSGCLAIGVLMVFVLEVWPPHRYARPFLAVGVLGGYTTFSAYTEQLRALLAGGRAGLALAYAGASLGVGFFATWAGVRVTTALMIRDPERDRLRAERAEALAVETEAHGPDRGEDRIDDPLVEGSDG